MNRESISNQGHDPENLPLEPKQEGNWDRQKVLRELDGAKKYLERRFDIDELSTIEGVHLRHLVEQCIPEAEKNRDEIRELERQIEEQRKEKGVANPALLARIQRLALLEFDNPGKEAAARWLFKLYNINIDDVPICDLIKDETSGERYKFFYPPELRSRQVYAVSQSESETIRRIRASTEFFENHEVELERKIKELKRLGHRVSVEGGIVEPEFKEYLHRLRDKSHKP